MNMIGSRKISNFNPSKIVLPEKEASALLSSVFERLDFAHVGYCVERNYQGYPDVLTGDVDLIIGDSSIPFVAQQVCDVAKENGWYCYQHHIWGKTAYLGLWYDGYPSRFTLTIELFSGARWHGIKFLDGVTVVNERLRHGITWKPSPAHQIIITAMHHLLYNGTVPQKYRNEIVSLMEFEEDSVKNNLTPFFGTRHAKKITKELVNQNWQYFDYKIARTLKILLLVRSLVLWPLTTLNDVTKGLISHFRNPEGVSISIEITPDLAKHALIESLLGIMTKWHVFKPPRREVVNPSLSVFKAKKLVENILSSGGVVLIDHAHASELTGRSSLPDYKIVQSERLVVFCQSSEIFSCGERLSIDGGNADQVALEIINSVLSHRALLNREFSH